jgi:hypothetical protein
MVLVAWRIGHFSGGLAKIGSTTIAWFKPGSDIRVADAHLSRALAARQPCLVADGATGCGRRSVPAGAEAPNTGSKEQVVGRPSPSPTW